MGQRATTVSCYLGTADSMTSVHFLWKIIQIHVNDANAVIHQQFLLFNTTGFLLLIDLKRNQKVWNLTRNNANGIRAEGIGNTVHVRIST
jgi:hypothetical protein